MDSKYKTNQLYLSKNTAICRLMKAIMLACPEDFMSYSMLKLHRTMHLKRQIDISRAQLAKSMS